MITTNAFWKVALPANSAQSARSLEEDMKKKAGLISKAIYDVLAQEESD